MMTRHSEINRDLLTNLPCYLATKKHWRKIKFATNSFGLFANSVASYCATPDEINFIPGTYKHSTSITINGISEGLKFSGCVSVSWGFQDDKKENIEIIIERVFRIPGLPIRLIFPQQVAKQTGHIGDSLHAENDFVLEDSNSLQNIMITVAFPYIILSTEFPNLRRTTLSFIKMAEKHII